MTTTILIIVNVFSALAIIVLALMQQSKGDMGSAFGGGGSQSMFGSRGSANFLSRTTAVMCAVFFISSLSLAYLYAEQAESSSVVVDQSVIDETDEASPADDSIPSIEGELPAIEGEVQSDEGQIPTIEGEVPAIEDDGAAVKEAGAAAEDAATAIESAAEAVPAIEDAAEQVEAEIPAVPE